MIHFCIIDYFGPTWPTWLYPPNKLYNTSLDADWYKNVAANHIIVVISTTNGYSNQSGNTPVSGAKRKAPTKVNFNTMEIIPEANIAVISLHALIRYQNQIRLHIQFCNVVGYHWIR